MIRSVLTAVGISLIPYAVDALSLIIMSAVLSGVTPQATLIPAFTHVGNGAFVPGA
jgi:hypothetical protein